MSRWRPSSLVLKLALVLTVVAAGVFAPVAQERADAEPTFFALNPSEIAFCAQSPAHAAGCALTNYARGLAFDDKDNWFTGVHAEDGRRGNAFLHSWWTILVASLVNREFAWDVVAVHETGYWGWQGNPSHEMDLHNDRVGYHWAEIIEGSPDTLQDLEPAVYSAASNAYLDPDGINGDYGLLIRIK